MPTRFFYRKADKLKSRKQIEALFNHGKCITAFPLKLWWIPENEMTHLQTGVGVSSRYFKKAVDRNRIKRLMREAYRLQKNQIDLLLEEREQKLSLFFLYIGKELPDYQTVYTQTGILLKKIGHVIKTKAE